MALTPIPPIEPVLPDPPDPLDDEATFDAAAYAWSAALPGFGSDLSAIGAATYANAGEALTAATDASNSATAAAASAVTASEIATVWVSGATYAVGICVYSPLNFLSYRRKIAGAGIIDPSLDVTNWAALSGVTSVNGESGAVTGIATTGANTFTAAQELASGASIASASTVNLDTATGNRVHITGTTTITAVTLTRGPRTVIFDGVLTLTHNATNNNLPGGVNITTAAGDRAVYEGDGTTVYCVSYIKASGLPLVSPAAGSLIYLLTVTGTNAATIDIEHAFDSTYDEYIIECPSLLTLTADQALRVQFKMGGVYDTATNYGYSFTYTPTGAPTGASVDSTSSAVLYYSSFISNTEPGCLSIKLFQPFSTNSKIMLADGIWHRSNGTAYPQRFMGSVVNKLTTALTGIRFFAQVGNITGTFHLYGVKKS